MSDLLTQLVTQVGGNSPTQDAALLTELSDSQIVSKLASEDPELAAALSQLESQLGGRETTLQRMEQREVTLPDDTENVLVAMQLGLRWFGGRPIGPQDDEVDPITISALLSIIRGVNADIVAVTEISNIRAFEELVNKVPQYRAVYGERNSGARLGTAMLYRADRVQLARQPETLDGGDYRFPRPPQILRFAFNDTEFQTVVVHLRSQRGSDGDPRGSLRRELEIRKIIAGLDNRPALPTLLLGVLNAPSGWVEFDGLRDSSARFAGRDLPVDATTFISDHFGPMVLSDFAAFKGLETTYLDDSVEVISLPEWLEETWTSEEITERISDHNPIIAAFDLGRLTQRE